MTTTTDRPNVEHGDRTVAMANEILRCTVGSQLHGIAIEGTDDHDEMGVYIEPPEWAIGLARPRDDYIHRTQPEGVRSGPGDTDLTMYSLQKYLRLAAKGNPTALLPLFAPTAHVITCTELGGELREMRDAFLSQQAVERFLGYMHAQHERMLGRGKQNRVPNRPELVEKYGWDVKYGSHALRLAYQGWEIAFQGRLTLPLKSSWRLRVLEVKSGEWPIEAVSAEIQNLERQTRRILAEQDTPLSVAPDWPRISAWAVAAHRFHWGWF